MKGILSVPRAATIIIVILFLFVAFHIFILFGVVPFENVWGGRIKSREEMVVFESVAVLITLLMIGIVAIKAGFLRFSFSRKLLNQILFIMGVIFVLNSLGNAASFSNLERYLFTPATVLLAALSFYLAFSRSQKA